MENASKALIIAGAILIAILLISFGTIIMNNIRKPIDEVRTESDTMAIQGFNSNFTTYEGNAVSADQVRALFNLVQSSNASNGYSTVPSDPNVDKYVYFDRGGITNKTMIKSGRTYSVNITGYSTGGYANVITILQNN